MKMNKIILGTISVLLVFFVSCTKFEKFESTELAGAPTVSLTTEAVMDSSVTVSFSSSAKGFLSFALFEGIGNPTPDSAALIQLNVDALDMGSGELASAGDKVMYEFTGLTQNTVYEVFAVSQNEDGVLSVVPDALMIKTSDEYRPVLNSTDPAPSATANKDANFEVVLVFDEPISTTDAGKFTFTYFLEGAEATAGSAVVNPDDPYQVIVTQSRAAHDGDYVFLSFAEGAVKDLVGNDVNGLQSGLDEEGYLAGLYWRVSKLSWDFDIANFVPEAGTAIADPEFVIEFKAPVVVENAVEDGSIRLIVYVDGVVTSIWKVPAANVVLADDGKTITVTKPFVPTYGENIYIEIDGGVFTDDFGNPNNAIESGMDGINPDEITETKIGWLISYGYTIDMIIGTYQVDGISYWAGSDESFEVTITADPNNENQIIATGIYYSEVPIVGVFDGDFATLTFYMPEDNEYWIELGDIYGDGASNSLEVYGGEYFVCHIDAAGNMTTNDEIWWGSYYYLDDATKGWNNIFIASTWTKATAGLNLEKDLSKDLRKLNLPKNFK